MDKTTSPRAKHQQSSSGRHRWYFRGIIPLGLIFCCCLSLGLNILHGSLFHLEHNHHRQTFFHPSHSKLNQQQLQLNHHSIINNVHVAHHHPIVKQKQNDNSHQRQQRQEKQQQQQDKQATVLKHNEQQTQEQQQQQKHQENQQQHEQKESKKTNNHDLSCNTHGGPYDEAAIQEMIYWHDIPQDANYKSPFMNDNNDELFLSFEPDLGGWNNIRMGLETIVALAVATGRTLVLPPRQGMYLIDDDGTRHNRHHPQKAKKEKQQKTFALHDFFPLEQIMEHNNQQQGAAFRVITMEEFLKRRALTGKLRDIKTNQISFPPLDNRTDWNDMTREIHHSLNPWLRSVGVLPPQWEPNNCIAAIPSKPTLDHNHTFQDADNNATIRLNEILNSLLRTIIVKKKNNEKIEQRIAPKWQQFIGHPTPVNASAADRLKEQLADRTRLCVYDDTLQKTLLLHFYGEKESRMLVLFYAFLFLEDWYQDIWIKRFIRDHVRYVDSIQCAAARIVQAIRQIAKQQHDGVFDSFHIRRGDFQYKVTRASAQEIVDISRDVIPKGSTVYIGTDERNKTFFEPLMKQYHVLFLDDFLHLLEDVNTNFYGMIDQLVVAKGRYFFGCWFSTFTGYINRLRGYHSTKQKLPGYEQGLLESYYYALPEHKMRMRSYYPLKKAFHAREFPVAWRDLDFFD